MKKFEKWQIWVAIMGTVLIPLLIFILSVGDKDDTTEIEFDGIIVEQRVLDGRGGGGTDSDGSVTIGKEITIRRHSNTTSPQGGTNVGTNTR